MAVSVLNGVWVAAMYQSILLFHEVFLVSAAGGGNGTYLASINRQMDMTIERYHSVRVGM